MKLTKSQVKQIIKEELAKMMEFEEDLGGVEGEGEGEVAEPTQPEEKQLSAVQRIADLLPVIKSIPEYSQLVAAVLRHQLPQEGDSAKGLLLALGGDTAIANAIIKRMQVHKK